MQPLGQENEELIKKILTEFNEKIDLAKKLLLEATNLITESQNLVSPCQSGLVVKFLSDEKDHQIASELRKMEQKLAELIYKLNGLKQAS